MKKNLFWMLSILIIATFVIASCTPKATPTTAPTEAKKLMIVYVTPSTESDYWGKYVQVGIENAVLDIKTKYGVTVDFSVQGPAAESSGDEYLSILESVIAQKPDIILVGQLQPDAVAPLISDATAAGIRVNLISIGVDLPGKEFGTLFYCDQPEQGALAAKAFFDAMVAKKVPMDGVVGMHMSVVVPVLEAKLDNFRTTLQGLAPNLTILETQYNENDVNNGITLMEAQLATYGDKLIGFFGGNNVTGDAIVKVIEESGRKNMVGVAVDSDPAEIEGMAAGYLDALIVQTPYAQGYGATMDAAKFVLEGIDSASDSTNMSGQVITPANMNTDESKALLDPKSNRVITRSSGQSFFDCLEPQLLRITRLMAEYKSVLQIKGASKSFPGVQALDNVDLIVHGSEVLGLVGENGAGKSTLIKILMGVYQMDSGEICLDGQPILISNPVAAQKFGLCAVYQDVVIASELSVGENFFLGKLPKTRIGTVDWNKVYEESYKYLKTLDIDINPRLIINKLSPGEQAMVTIAKIVRENARFVIFDEPTARLTNEETAILFKLIKKLRNEGLGIIYISHHMEEIFEICGVITVLRDGKLVGTQKTKDVNEDKLISMMVGRTIEEMYSIKHASSDETVLEVKNITHEPHFRNISFCLRRGEVLGFFGLVGAGRTDVLRAIFGADKLDSGEIFLNGDRVHINSPVKGMSLGIGLVPEDRKQQGLALPLTVRHNIDITIYDRISKLGIINMQKEKDQASSIITELNIRTPSMEQVIGNLSGGNQQKVAIGKWLSRESSILLLDEPTSGVDIGAKHEIYNLVQVLVEQGKSVIICSSYLPEVIGLSDRILVMAEGSITGEVNKIDANEELLLRLASKINISN
jgi:ribose transport system ATP-binding protein